MEHSMIWLIEQHTDGQLIGLSVNEITVVKFWIGGGSHVLMYSGDEFFVEEAPEQIKDIMAAVNCDVRDNSWAALQARREEV